VSKEEKVVSERGKKTHLFLDVLANLIVNLEFLLKLIELFLANFALLDSLFARRNGRREKVEE